MTWYTALALVLVMICPFTQVVVAQPTNGLLNDVVTPNPTAATLGEYVSTPVSKFTGLPNIGVPIHTVKEGRLTVPVSLNYHAGGVRVAAPTGLVGLSWTLNAGGAITRTVMGLPDDDSNGYYRVGHSLNPNTISGQIDDIVRGELDGEPDIFSFNFLGYTGKFIFDGSGTSSGIVNIPNSDIIFEPIFFGNGPLSGFKAILPSGNKVYFGVTPAGDGTFTANGSAVESSEVFRNGGTIGPPGGVYNSSWFVTKVESSDGNHVISFEYTGELYDYLSPASSIAGSYHVACEVATEFLINNPQYVGGAPANNIRVSGSRLRRIYTTTTEILFVAEDVRMDLVTIPQQAGLAPRELDRIEIREGDGANDFANPNFCKVFFFSVVPIVLSR